MDTNTAQPTVDPTALALSRSIRSAEGGDYNNISGDNGTSAGAYQFNNGKVPLKKGEIPANFKSWATEEGLDPNDFSQTNQDHVAYNRIKKKLDAGQSQSSIAAEWNSGLSSNWENHKGTVNIGGKDINYDTPAYVAKVQKFYQDQMNGAGTSDASDSSTKKKSFDDIPDTQSSSTDLQAGSPTTPGNTNIGNVVANFTPGSKLAQGLGYGLAAASGSQKGLIQANDAGMDIEGQLIKQIKNDKAKGKDTTRLEKSLKELGMNLQEQSGQVSDVGTGGITTKEVVKSAASLASLPAMAYAGTALGGGGIRGTAQGLESGLLGEATPKALSNPIVKEALTSALGKGETIANLSRQEAIDALGTHLKDMTVKQIGGKEEKLILKALETLKMTGAEKQGLIKTLAKFGYNTAKNLALTQVLGNTVGELIHKITP